MIDEKVSFCQCLITVREAFNFDDAIANRNAISNKVCTKLIVLAEVWKWRMTVTRRSKEDSRPGQFLFSFPFISSDTWRRVMSLVRYLPPREAFHAHACKNATDEDWFKNYLILNVRFRNKKKYICNKIQLCGTLQTSANKFLNIS